MSVPLLFGKLPARGDFIWRGFDPGERDALDAWLSAELAAARADLGEGFDAAFDAAPPWRFAWRDAGAWTAGAMAPSVDAAGRRFPLLLAVAGRAAEEVADAAAACEDRLYALIGDGAPDVVVEAPVRIARGGGGARPEGEGWWSAMIGGREEARLEGRRPDGLLLRMLAPAEDGA